MQLDIAGAVDVGWTKYLLKCIVQQVQIHQQTDGGGHGVWIKHLISTRKRNIPVGRINGEPGLGGSDQQRHMLWNGR